MVTKITIVQFWFMFCTILTQLLFKIHKNQWIYRTLKKQKLNLLQLHISK